MRRNVMLMIVIRLQGRIVYDFTQRRVGGFLRKSFPSNSWRRVPLLLADEIDRQCSELCDADIIKPNTSSGSSLIVSVCKKDGENRRL